MENHEDELQKRLDAFELDEAGATGGFVTRLARENGWTLEYAARAIQEYKRFVLLAVTVGHPVTPSDAVDQVWHQHLTYSESYWGSFCAEALRQPLHHRPSRGGSTARHQYIADYEKTLESYRVAFDEPPPADIWPDSARRFGVDTQWVRVNTTRHWLVPKRWLPAWAIALGVASVGGISIAAREALALPGRSFLLLYLLVWALSLAAAWLIRRWSEPRSAADMPKLDAYEVAYLKGGDQLVMNAALAQLIATRVVVLDVAASTMTRDQPLPDGAHPVERAIHERLPLAEPLPASTLLNDARPRVRDIAERTLPLGLRTTAGSSLPLLVALSAPAFGAIKALLGLWASQPAGVLLALCLIGGCVAWATFKPRAGLTRDGEALLRQLSREHAGARGDADPVTAIAAGMLPMSVALSGLGVLASFGLDDLSEAFGRLNRVTMAGSGGSVLADNASAGCCGGGDGGCGGGCGCGGCG